MWQKINLITQLFSIKSFACREGSEEKGPRKGEREKQGGLTHTLMFAQINVTTNRVEAF